MSGAPDMRIRVGVVIERRKAKSPWVDFVWRPQAVLPGQPDVAPWTVLEEDGERTSFYAGAVDVALFRSDAPQYRENLDSGCPSLWVVLRSGHDPAMPFEVVLVTADPSEGESHTAAGDDIIDMVRMPQPVEAAVAAFVEQHYVEQPFYKRERRESDPEALARRRPERKS